jgi:hypothetical protein
MSGQLTAVHHRLVPHVPAQGMGTSTILEWLRTYARDFNKVQREGPKKVRDAALRVGGP